MTTAFLNVLFKQVQGDPFRLPGKTEVKISASISRWFWSEQVSFQGMRIHPLERGCATGIHLPL